MTTFKAWINPLKFPEIDLPGQDGHPTADRVVDYLSDPGDDIGLPAFLERYHDIASVNDPLFVAPAENNILQKLVWPLRHAKGSYALGNHLGCIAMCGMVGEMVAILLWEISKASLQQAQIDKATQKALFGNTFERFGQARRVQVLRTFNIVDDQTGQAFDRLRSIRRRYLHFFSQEHTNVVDDSRQAYAAALGVVEVVLGQSVQNGAISLRPDLMAYLTEHGIVQDENGA